MAEENSILTLMVSHHALLEALFFPFRDEARDNSKRAEASLSELVWEIRKHFFIEESAIFDFIPLKTMKIFETMNHLRDEHLMMLIDLKRFSENFSEIKSEDIENFYKLLMHHREMEEKELYPQLDKELNDEQKRHIIHRINEIPVTKNFSK